MNNPLSAELTVLRQHELQAEANARRQMTVTPAQNSLPNVLNAVLSAFTQRSLQTSTADEQAHLAWVADQA